MQLEALETRVLLTADVTFNSGTNTLDVTDNNDTGNNNTITIRAGSAYTDILVNGKFQTRITEATSNNIGTINFDGGAGTDTLNVIGVNGPSGSVSIDLTATERLLLNTKNTTVTAKGPLALGKSTVAGTLDIDMSGADAGDDLTQFGKVSVSDAVTVTTKDGDVRFSSSGNSFGTLILDAGTGVININEAGPTTLGDITASALVVKSTGAITDNGTLTIGAGGTTLTSSSSITLDDAASVFGGTVALKGTNIQIDHSPVTAATLTLGNVTATGTLTVTSNGNVSHTAGNMKVTGLATISVDDNTTQHILLTGGTNNFGSLSLDGNNVSVTEKSAMDLDTTTATGNLTLIAKGAITDSGEVNVTGATSLTATGSSITLDESTSTYAGAITVVTATNVAITNDTATVLAAVTAKGTFSLTSGGVVSDTGALTITGRATIDATGFDITLDTAANVFGSLSLFGANVTIAETGGTVLHTSEITGNFVLNANGTATVTDTGDVLVSGTTNIDATGDAITLDSAGSGYTGAITLTGSNITLVNTEATTFAAVNATGTLTVTSDDDVTDTGDVNVAGLLTVTTPGDVVLNSAGNSIGSISITGSNVTIVDDGGGLDIVSVTASGNLSVTTAGGALTDSGAVVVTGTTTLAAGAANDITLNTATNSFGGNVTITTGNNVTLVDSDGLGLGISGTAISGNLNLTANGDVTDNGAALTVGTAGGVATTVTVNAGSTGSISFTGTNFADEAITLTLTGVNATFIPTVAPAANARDITLGATSLSGTLTMSNVSDVTDSGKLTIAGTVTIDAFDDAVDVIVLDNIGNTFGTLNLDAFNITVVEAAATNLGTVSADGDLSITSSGDVTDSGTITVAGTASVTSNGGDVTLDSAANSFVGALTLSGDDITIQDAGTTVLASVSAKGTFTLTTTGAVSQTGNVSVGGLATISTTSTINLDGAAQTINFGSLSLTGTNVSINEDSATNLASVNATTLTVISAGAITDSGTLTVTGASSFSAGAGGLDAITLDDPNNDFGGSMTLTGGNITVNNNNATDTDLAAVTAAGSFKLTSRGDVTDSGTLTIAGLAEIVAYNGTSNEDITLDTGTNNFSSLSVTGANVTINDDGAGGIDLSTSSVTGKFTLTADGDVSDSGVLTFGGEADITTTGDLTLDEAGSTFTTIDFDADSITLLAYSGVIIEQARSTVGDVTIIASGAISDVAGGGINSAVNIFVQAGMDPNDPTRELDPNDPDDAALLHSLTIDDVDPVFTGTETYIGSVVNVL